MNKHVLTRPTLKTAAVALDGPRAELADAIGEVEASEAAAKKSQGEVKKAEDHLRAMELANARAMAALEAARVGQLPLADKLAAAHSDSERWDIVEEHEAAAGRPAVTTEDLRRLRADVELADDEVVAARSALSFAREHARPATSALSRAKDRRQKAIHEVVRPEVGRTHGRGAGSRRAAWREAGRAVLRREFAHQLARGRSAPGDLPVVA